MLLHRVISNEFSSSLSRGGENFQPCVKASTEVDATLSDTVPSKRRCGAGRALCRSRKRPCNATSHEVASGHCKLPGPGSKSKFLLLNVTLELVRRGYNGQQIEKLWGGDLLRVMDEVQRIARELQKYIRN
jgi:hypothetical protein